MDTVVFDPTRLFTLIDTYTSQVGDSIRYIIEIRYDMTARVPLRIRYIDNGGNYHSIGFNNRGLLTFD